MSYVTNLVLITGVVDEDVADLGFDLRPVSDHAGGTKAMECNVFLAAVNYFVPADFNAKWVPRRWTYPEEVLLVVNTQEGVTLAFHAGQPVDLQA